MQILYLSLADFCGHSFSEINFEDFTTALIVGKKNGNEKISNGVGKSTIFNAIKYVLFNEVDFSTLEKVIRHGQDSCRVITVLVGHDGHKYKIERTKSRKAASDLRLFRWNDGWIDLTQRKASDTEKELQKIIKINFKTFCNTVLFSQAEILSGLAALTPTVRKAALKEALQLNIYSALEKLAKKKTSDLLKEIEKSEVILSTIGDPENDINEAIAKIAEFGSAIDSKKQQVSILDDQFVRASQAFETARTAFNILDEKSKNDRARKDTLKTEIEQDNQLLNGIKSKGARSRNDEKEMRETIVSLEYTLKNASETKTHLQSIMQEIEALSKEEIKLLSALNGSKNELNELSIPLPDGAVCSHCRQPMTIEHRVECQKQIDADRVSKTVLFEKQKDEYKAFAVRQAKMVEKRKQLKLADDKNIADENKLINKRNELSSLEKWIGEYKDQYLQIAERRSAKEAELQNIQVRLLAFNGEYQVAQSSLRIAEDNSKSIRHNTSILDKEMQELSSIIAVLNDNKHRRANDLEKKLELTNAINDLKSKYSIHQEVVQAFGSSGIPALITHTILDDFQIETNVLLTQLKPGLQSKFTIEKDRDGDKSDTLDITYVLDGHDVEYAQLSGAQKLIASLCLKLGLAAVIKKRLDIEIKILLIDEIDQSLDDESLEAFEDAIKRLQQDYKILVITHKKELKERFTTAIVVEQNENLISTAKVSNSW